MTRDDTMYCWGANVSGQLGTGDVESRSVPTPVAGDLGQVSSMSTGLSHTCAINAEQSLFCWGSNSEGQLGLDAALVELDTTQPIQVNAERWLSVSCGRCFRIVILRWTIWQKPA